MDKKEILMPEGIEVIEEKKNYGKFVFSPLERGFGITVGNALRRVLLSNIQGSAIFAIRIDGVSHEFSSIKGVLEDVPLIILNLKKIRVKYNGDSPYVNIPLTAAGEMEIFAKEFRAPSSVEILTPQQKIATLTSKSSKIAMEVWVMNGRGYVPLEELKTSYIDKRLFPHDTIFIDADFSPVRKVNFIVENVRIEHRTDYEKLILEIETDGSITPLNALIEAKEIILKHFERITLKKERKILAEKVKEKPKKEKEDMKMLLLSDLEILDLPPRTITNLATAKIYTVGALVQRKEEEISAIKNLGKKAMDEIKEKLQNFGLNFEMDISEYVTQEELDEAQKEVKKTREAKGS
ncbi:MAG: DNA-directed RNA polymerase subunit alpha [candidate division WOR-3 bacterium]